MKFIKTILPFLLLISINLRSQESLQITFNQLVDSIQKEGEHYKKFIIAANYIKDFNYTSKDYLQFKIKLDSFMLTILDDKPSKKNEEILNYLKCSLFEANYKRIEKERLNTLLNLNEKFVRPRALMQYYLYFNQYYYRLFSLDTAKLYLDSANNMYNKVLADTNDNKRKKDLIYFNLNYFYYVYYKGINDYEKAIEYNLINYKFTTKNNYKEMQLKSLQHLSSLYYRVKNYDSYLKTYDEIIKAISDSIPYNKDYQSMYINTTNNLGAVYIKLNKLDSARLYLNKIVDSTLKFFPNHHRKIIGAYLNIGVIEKKQGNFEEAMKYYKSALNYALDNAFASKNSMLKMIYLNIGSLNHSMGNIDKTINNIKKSLEIKSNDNLYTDMKSMENLYKVYKQDKKDYKNALFYYEKHTKLKDSILDNNFKEKLSALEMEIDKMSVENELKLTAKEKKISEIKRKKAEQKYYLVLILSILVLMSSAIIIYFIIKKKRAEKKLFEEIEEKNKNKILDLMKNMEMNSLSSFMKGQEEERKKIASDLHDRLGSLFSTVKLYFSSLESKMPNDEDTKGKFKKLISLVDQSVDEVRKVSHNLAKDDVVQFGLVKSVEDIKNAVNSSNKINMEVLENDYNYNLNPDSEMQVFKAIQEMITNTIRHANAKNISVQFTSISDDEANIIVEDDGKGIPTNAKKGMGLKNIHDRINNIGAELIIDTSPKIGTTFIINLKKNRAA